MKQKSQLRTVRLTTDEASRVDQYLQQNPIFESFSALTRVALLTFIGEAMNISLVPATGGVGKKPTFLWDYDLTEVQIREILGTRGLSDQKRWLIERILTQARFDEAMKYLILEDIQAALPTLRLPAKVKGRWEYALKRWKS